MLGAWNDSDASGRSVPVPAPPAVTLALGVAACLAAVSDAAGQEIPRDDYLRRRLLLGKQPKRQARHRRPGGPKRAGAARRSRGSGRVTGTPDW